MAKRPHPFALVYVAVGAATVTAELFAASFVVAALVVILVGLAVWREVPRQPPPPDRQRPTPLLSPISTARTSGFSGLGADT